MKVLLDTNIILDVLLNREKFCEDSASILELSAEQNIELYVTATALTDIYYIAYKNIRNKDYIIKMIKQLLRIVNIAGVTKKEILFALNANWADFEDSVQYAVADIQKIDVIITRNTKDYEKSQIPVYSPHTFLEKFRT